MKDAPEKLFEVLKHSFGFTSFRPLQEETIRDSLDGKDVFALLPTGGKTAPPARAVRHLGPITLESGRGIF